MQRVAEIAAAGVVAGAIAVLLAGRVVWNRATARDLDALERQARGYHAQPTAPIRHSDLVALPAPVARYLWFALPDGQRRIGVARIRWTGDMHLHPGARWCPFTAEQRFSASPPGFVWDAHFPMAPLLPIVVRDSYLGGQGEMLARLASVASVVNEGGTPEMAQSALARWLGEAPWFPTALVPGEGVTWEPVDDSTARATVADGALRVSAHFHFARTGELTGISGMRYRDVDGTSVLTPFEGRYGRFERRAGAMVPTRSEVAWLLPEGRYPYWRGELTSLTYDH